MFKRRQPLSRIRSARELVWPSMGWCRAARYFWLRIARLSDSPHSIALGLAIGVAIGFSPLVGTHFFQCFLFAYLLRGNILCALVACNVANPWTYPFIWWGGLKFGAYIFSVFGIHVADALPAHFDFSIAWYMLLHEPWTILLPWMAGGTVLGILSMPFVYIIGYRLALASKAARVRSRLARIHQVANEMTGGAP